MILISQIDNPQKENLLAIFKFLNVRKLRRDNQKKNSYKRIEECYALLVSYVDERHFKIELNVPNFWDINRIFSNIISTGTQINLFRYFIKLTLYERKNLLSIVKFVYDYQENQVSEKPWRLTAHDYWNTYMDLTQNLKSLLINENIEEY